LLQEKSEIDELEKHGREFLVKQENLGSFQQVSMFTARKEVAFFTSHTGFGKNSQSIGRSRYYTTAKRFSC
jgi:hypothetical protein